MKSVDGVFPFLEKLVTDFNIRRLIVVLTLISLVLGGIVFFESYTGHFRLSRLAASTEVLEQLSNLEASTEDAKLESLSKSKQAISEDLRAFVSRETRAFQLPRWAMKAGAMGIPWLVVLLLMIASGGITAKETIIGVSIIAVPLMIISVYLPDFPQAWINYCLIPLASCFLVVVPLAIYGNKTGK